MSFDAPALDQHLHVEAGQLVELFFRLEAGAYLFECLGRGTERSSASARSTLSSLSG